MKMAASNGKQITFQGNESSEEREENVSAAHLPALHTHTPLIQQAPNPTLDLRGVRTKHRGQRKQSKKFRARRGTEQTAFKALFFRTVNTGLQMSMKNKKSSASGAG